MNFSIQNWILIISFIFSISCAHTHSPENETNNSHLLKIHSQKVEEGKLEISKFAQTKCAQENKTALIEDSNFKITPIPKDKLENKPRYRTKAARKIPGLKNVYGGRKNLSNKSSEDQNIKEYEIELNFICK